MACVPTGMKTGVSMVPCGVCSRPARARVCGQQHAGIDAERPESQRLRQLTAGGLIGTPDARWNDNDLQCLTSLTLSNFEPVNVSSLMVSNTSGATSR